MEVPGQCLPAARLFFICNGRLESELKLSLALIPKSSLLKGGSMICIGLLLWRATGCALLRDKITILVVSVPNSSYRNDH